MFEFTKVVQEEPKKLHFTPAMRRKAKKIFGEEGYQKLLAWNQFGLVGDTIEDLQFIHQAIKNGY